MASKKTSQLPVATSVADNDSVIIVTGTTPTTKRALKSVLLDGLATVAGLATKADASALTNHTSNTSNPHNVTKAQVGLGNAENTPDAAKPVSTAQQAALNGRQFKTFMTVGSSDADYITDGSADQVQIQQAIDAAVISGGGVVFVKTGTYNISSPIVVKSGVWIRGAGMGSTVFAGTSSLNGAIMHSTGTSAETPIHDLILSDFKYDGSAMTSANNTSLKGITGEFWLRTLIQNVWCYNTPATGFGFDFMRESAFTNCVAELCGNYGGDPGFNGFGQGTGGWEEESIVYTNCYAVGNGNNGFLLEWLTNTFSSRNFQFVNCYASDNGRKGFRNSGSSGATFINCKAVNNTEHGFYTTRFSNRATEDTTIMGCDAYGNGKSGIFFELGTAESDRNTICIGNHSYQNGQWGIYMGGTRAQIKDNICWENNYSGIKYHVGQSDERVAADISGNTVYNNGRSPSGGDAHGIMVSCVTGPINGLKITTNTAYDDQATTTQKSGILVTGMAQHALISGNAVWGGNETGIWFGVNKTTPTLGLKIVNNVCYNNGKGGVGALGDGIRISATNSSGPIDGALVQGNTCYDSQSTKTQDYGIVLKDYIINAQVLNNDVRNNQTAPILDSPVVATLSNQYSNNKGWNPDEAYAQGSVTGATTFNRLNGSTIIATLTGNITVTLTAGKVAGDQLTLILTQDATGSRTVSWPSNFKKAGGSLVLSTAANAVDVITMRWDGTNWREVSRSMGLS
jgi:hypothetical protein